MNLWFLKNYDQEDKVKIFSTLSGFTLAFSWIIVLDAAGYKEDTINYMTIPPQFFLPGVASTLSAFILTTLDLKYLFNEEAQYTEFPQHLYEQRTLLLLCLCFFIVSLIVSIYVCQEYYFKSTPLHGKISNSSYPGFALIIQSILIPISCAFFKVSQLQYE